MAACTLQQQSRVCSEIQQRLYDSQSLKYLLWPLKKHVSQSLDLSTGGGVMAGKAVKGD